MNENVKIPKWNTKDKYHIIAPGFCYNQIMAYNWRIQNQISLYDIVISFNILLRKGFFCITLCCFHAQGEAELISEDDVHDTPWPTINPW